MWDGVEPAAGKDDRDASVETATGSRETVVAVDDLEEEVAEKLGAWDIPERGTDRPLRVVASDVRWRDGGDQRWLTVERVSASVRAGVLTGGAIVLAVLPSPDRTSGGPVVLVALPAASAARVAGVSLAQEVTVTLR